jgi:hypothetical protein
LGRTTPADIYAGAFDSEEISQSQDLSVSENDNSTIISGYIRPGAEHQFPSVDFGDLEPAVVAGQHPPAADSGNPIRTEDLASNETIDPAILNDRAFPGGGQIEATGVTRIAECPGRCPSECFRFLNQDPSLQCRRHNAERTESPGRQFSKPNKRSSAGTRRSKNGAGRSTKGPDRHKRVSFPAIRAQFSALPVEDRLQFLSWPFEGALSHCVSTLVSSDTASVSECISSQVVDMSYDCVHPGSSTELDGAQPTRKGLPWFMEENCLLVSLREEQNLAWSEVARLFAKKFPGRSKGSLQAYWSTTLKKQRLALVDVA